MKTLLFIIALLISSFSIAATIPQIERDSLKESAAQISLIYPVGSQGTNSTDYYNHFSFNLIAGYTGGLQGFEFGGMMNIDQNFVKGVQLAGMGNISAGPMRGAQVAGFMNMAQTARGLQSAGFMNLSTSTSQATQLAGFLNVVRGDNQGAQIAGFANIAKAAKGIQLAGFTNIVAGDMEGFQGSGFINIARNVKGVQLSVFNVADSVDGVPIGFLSIVRKNGYSALEIWASESLHTNIGFKVGVEKFYNIFAIGTQFADTDFRWGFGYGFGTLWRPAPTVGLNLDLISYTIYEEDNQPFKDQDLNLLNTLRFGISKQFSKHFGLFIAPTFNVMVSQITSKEAGNIGSDIAPWTVYDKTFNHKTNVKMWPGFHAGIRF